MGTAPVRSDGFANSVAKPEESPGFLLWQVANLWQREQRAALKPLDLTPVQFVLVTVLSWLSLEEPAVTQIDLAYRAKTDPMMTSQVIRALAERGLVERRQHPGDNRAYLVTVTPAGRDLANRALPLVEAVDRRFFGSLGSAVANELRALLENAAGG
jgi:DNA-binding MarR family transcriptional regulator